MTNNPLVSILLPTYNRRTLLQEAIESCLNQTLKDVEIVVVVDGCTDDTMNYLTTITDIRVRVHYQENKGLCESLNVAMKLAKGQLFQILNDDDRLPPESSKLLYDYLLSHADVDGVFGELVVIDEFGNYGEQFRVTNAKQHISMMGKVWHWSKPMIRREAAERVGGFKSEYDRIEDVDYFIRLRHAVKLDMIPFVVYEYRRHLGSSMINRYYTFIVPYLKMRLSHVDTGAISLHEVTSKEIFFEAVRAACYYGRNQTKEILNQVISLAEKRNEAFVKELKFAAIVLNTWFGKKWIRIGFFKKGMSHRIQNLFYKLHFKW